MSTSSSRASGAAGLSFMIMLAFPALLPAQSLWLDCHQHPALALEVIKPNFSDETFLNNTTFPTAMLFLSLRYPITASTAVVTELPFAHGGVEFTLGSNGDERISESALGNPYLGLEVGGRNSSFFAEIGARAPVTRIDNLGGFIAALAEIADRPEAFVPEYLPLIALANFRYRRPGGFALRLRGGPSFWINTEKGEDDDATEWFVLYSAQVGYETETAGVQLGASGRWFLTTEDDGFGENTVHEFGMAASLGLGRVWPGLAAAGY